MPFHSSNDIRRSDLLAPFARTAYRRRSQALLQPLEERRLLAATLWVDPSVAPAAGIFSTINSAVIAAKNGDTIKVVPGNYQESVEVTKTLTIIGGQQRLSTQPAGNSIIFANPGFNTFGFALEANSITIQSFYFESQDTGITTNAAWCGYNILNNTFFETNVGIHLNTITSGVAKTTTISGNLFQSSFIQPTLDDVLIDGPGARSVIITSNQFVADNTDASVKVNAASLSTDIQILNNDVQFDTQIVVANATSVKIDGNKINNSTITAKTGIHLAGTVTKSEISGNIIAIGTPYGILVDNALSLGANSMNNILKNSISGSLLNLSIGINLVGASLNTITSNTIFGMTNGIALSGGSSQNTITSNTLSNNTIGLHVTGSTGNTITKNTANGNRSDGMLFDAGANGNTISSNTASFNSGSLIGTDGNGMEFKSANGNTISQNITNSNFRNGMLLGLGCTANTLSHNTASDNVITGFVFSGVGLNTIVNNTATNNLADGFDLGDQNGDTATSNTATGNMTWGFLVSGVGNVLKSDTANFNAGGIVVSGNNNSITNCTANSNLASGLALSSTGNIATGNNAQKNGQYGIVAFVNGNIITGNSASGNILYDLYDFNGLATTNLWTKNNGKTRSPATLH